MEIILWSNPTSKWGQNKWAVTLYIRTTCLLQNTKTFYKLSEIVLITLKLLKLAGGDASGRAYNHTNLEYEFLKRGMCLIFILWVGSKVISPFMPVIDVASSDSANQLVFSPKNRFFRFKICWYMQWNPNLSGKGNCPSWSGFDCKVK